MSWQLQEAKQKFSELVWRKLEEEPQVVTRHGEKVVVMVPAEEWEQDGLQRVLDGYAGGIERANSRASQGRLPWRDRLHGRVLSFVLDTNVVFELRKKFRADAGVMRWFSSVETDELYVSVLVIGGIRRGIEGLRRRDPMQAGRLETWLAGLRRDYADRILSVDQEAAEEWGRINVPNPVSSRDGLMAATAKVRNMTFVTRNTADVQRAGVRLLNPFEVS